MNTATTELVTGTARLHWTRRPKIDQWISWWTIPVFYNIFGLIFVVLTRVMPPPRPDVGPDQIVAFFTEHSLSIRIGFGLLMIFIGFTGFANGLIAFQIKRMSVAPVFSYAYIASLAVGAVPGCLFAAFAFVAAAYRPDRNPELVAMLYDLGLLSFVGSLGCFATQNMVLALAIFLDRNDVLPKWLAYMSIWMIVTELLAGPVFVFKSGPLAWNGSISFYIGTVIFVLWEVCIIVLLFRAIKRQPAAELVAD
ncbi:MULTISPECIES: hypothetical protein [unclassified Mycolicibacterium]|uniref:hypothetical protein n=1 Tax=unclassified Mycolicibacterium TaxID=2636767 RepID=UPI0012DF90B3|nr:MULTISPECIES: hypothetical protein [unclassified Mycolicibacterium]MUL83423.1 hypothetical protein [Mycolicibacterium sp. CBMA 329]MUL90414.1 hypothetical protein [Mycolicibacterium sp. CBMA 331]MUM00387.1 hypothetical protein [Mycolicibacterium sp. CBMA 334]MUM29783.1 hypothetical protein [Mycolicibacterium sp. CBMA 295]MUM41358.1 hypothetical protein [Mycolicibacterium sp. CBMA 247]